MNLPPPRQIALDQTAPGQAIPASKAKPRIRKWLIAGAALIGLLGAFWHFTDPDNASERGIRGALQQLIDANNQHAGAPPSAQGRSNAAPVRVAEVARRDMQVIRRTPGTVVANTMVQITARVQGIIESANFKEGQFVKKGDLLFQIDPRPFEAALEQAQAQLDRDKAQLGSAQADADRGVMLSQRGIVSDQQRDQLVAAAKALTATIGADQAAIKVAQLNLEYSRIRSPVDGKTGPILIQPGNMVLATGTTPLVTIAEIQPVKISFSLPQADLQLILARQRKRALTATVDVDGTNGEPLSAPVDFTSNVVNNQSGTVELRATFDNKDFSFLPGQLVNVTVELDTIPSALVVPRDAISEGPDGSFVYVVTDGKARQQSVKVLFDDAKNIAIEGDVKPGDHVIVEGQLRVDPSGAVNVLGSTGLPGAGAAPAAAQDQGRRAGNGG